MTMAANMAWSRVLEPFLVLFLDLLHFAVVVDFNLLFFHLLVFDWLLVFDVDPRSYFELLLADLRKRPLRENATLFRKGQMCRHSMINLDDLLSPLFVSLEQILPFPLLRPLEI